MKEQRFRVPERAICSNLFWSGPIIDSIRELKFSYIKNNFTSPVDLELNEHISCSL
jgi:hypothetical protein